MGNKKKTKKSKRIRYTPIDEYVNPETALVQAALLLDEAAFDAIESKNPKHMASVARGWMELGAVLHNISVASEEEESEGDEEEDVTSILGFGSTERREALENARKS